MYRRPTIRPDEAGDCRDEPADRAEGYRGYLCERGWRLQGRIGWRTPEEAKYPNVIKPSLEIGGYGTEVGKFIDPINVAVGPSDHIYVADKGNHRVQMFDRDGNLVEKWGSQGSTPMQFSAPEAVTISTDGVVYVADSANHRIQRFTTQGVFLNEWGAVGSAKGEFSRPKGIAVDATRVYVADTSNDRVQVFDRSGEFQFIVGEYGDGDAQFNRPESVSVDENGFFYVADTNNQRIQKFDADGAHVTTWGGYGSKNGELAEPTALDVHVGEVFVTDTINHRIQVFSTDGEYLYQWGRHPATPERAHAEMSGRTHYPIGISASPDGSYVVMSEPFENRVKLFEKDAFDDLERVDDSAWWAKDSRFHYGTGSIASFDTLAVAEPDTHSIVLFNLDKVIPEKITRIGGMGSELGQLISPTGLGLDIERKRMYASDKGNHRIQVFDLSEGSAGEVQTAFGEYGTEPGNFNEPSGIDTDSDGNIFAVDNENGRIQVFDEDFELLRSWGETGSGQGQFNQPLDISLGPDEDRLFVVDSFNYRIQSFDTDGNHLTTWGKPSPKNGEGKGRFVWPYGIEARFDGYVYVSDPGGQRIQKFDLDGNWVSEWGEFGTEPGQFYKPKGITQHEETD